MLTNDLDITAPAVIAFLSMLSVVIFEQPPAVFITAIGGALWAIWRASPLGFWRSTGYILAASITACALVSVVVWFLNLLGYNNAPVRGLAGLIAFIIIDAHWRAKVFGWIGGKVNEVGK